MSAPKHSPAPWKFYTYRGGRDGFIMDANGDYVTEYAGCGSHGCDIPNPADRPLLLAAPIMYEFVATRAAGGDTEAIKILEAINGNT